MKYFLTVCLNPTLQRTLLFDAWHENKINRANQKLVCASGKGVNTTRVLHQLKAKAVHLTITSEDPNESFLVHAKRDKLNIEAISSPIEIRRCITLINTTNHHVTEVIEPSSSVPAGTEEAIIEKFTQLLEDAHTVALCGSVANGFSKNVFAKMTSIAKKAKKTVIIDATGPLLTQSLRYHPDYIKINVHEFLETFFPGTKHDTDDFFELAPLIQQKVRELLMRHHAHTILTLGKKGCVGFDKHQTYNIPPSHTTEPVINTIGCGDTFLAGFLYKLHKEPENFKGALEFASDCAAKNATTLKPGCILS